MLASVKAYGQTAGSHLDIPPTLYELAAPKDFGYTAFGQSMLHKHEPSYGLGYQFINGQDFIAENRIGANHYRLPGTSSTLASPASTNLDPVVEKFRALKALSWYRVKHGTQLP